MTVRIAVRNLARQRRRTLLIGLLFLFAAASLVVTTSVANGIGQMVDESIQQYLTGGVMVRDRSNNVELGKLQTGKIKTIGAWPEVERFLAARSDVTGIAKRISFTAMLMRGDEQVFATVAGIKDQGNAVLPVTLQEGAGLDADHNGVLVSSKQARDLGLKVGDMVRLAAADQQGRPQILELRVNGILSTVNFDLFRQSEVLVDYASAAQLFGTAGAPTEYLVNAIDSRLLADEMGAALQGHDVVVQHWTKAGSEFLKSKDQLSLSVLGAFGLFSVVIVAMLFTMMQLQTAERVREIGAMSSMGMTWPQILRLLLTETALLGAISSATGAGLAYAGSLATGASGVPWGDAPAAIFGGTTLFPAIAPGVVVLFILSLTLLGMLGALMPALRAARMNPADSLRFV